MGSDAGRLAGLLEEARARLGAERGTIYAVEPDGAVSSRVTTPVMVPAIRLRPGEGVAGWVAASGEVVTVPHAALAVARRFDRLTGFETRTLHAVPLRHGGRVVGVLQLLNGPFGEAAPPPLDDLVGPMAADVAAAGGSPAAAPPRPRSRLPEDTLPPTAVPEPADGLWGESPAMAAVKARLARAAPTGATVLLRGPTGSGKERAARALHEASTRAGEPFVVVDCAALPESLLENELFGHERGAFTGADRAREGRVQAAEGGTLFLDEIGELPPAVQGKLLRLVQERRFHRVGGAREEAADVRIVAATWRDLEAEVAAGRFRADLYWRLRVVEIRLPGLAERGGAEVLGLARRFLTRFAARYGRPELRWSGAAERALVAAPWPGNVRELEHRVEAAVVLGDGPALGPADLGLGAEIGDSLPPGGFAAAEPAGEPGAELPGEPDQRLDAAMRRHIRAVLAACGGNRSEAARRLGIGRGTLARWLD